MSEGDGVLSVHGGDPTEVLDVFAGGAAGAAAAHVALAAGHVALAAAHVALAAAHVALAAAHEALLPLTRRHPWRPRPGGL